MAADSDILTFDCYGTLIDWRGGISDAFTELGTAVGRPVDRDRILDLHARFEPEVQREEFRSYREVLDLVAMRIATELDIEIPENHHRFLSESLANWPPFADTVPALERLQGAGYRLGILSNVDDDLLAGTLRHLSVDFDLLITAQQVGSYKPALGHFRRARQQIGDAPWIHVAQSFFHDVEPAVILGLSVVWINRLREEPYFEAGALTQFPDMGSFAEQATSGSGLSGS